MSAAPEMLHTGVYLRFFILGEAETERLLTIVRASGAALVYACSPVACGVLEAAPQP